MSLKKLLAIFFAFFPVLITASSRPKRRKVESAQEKKISVSDVNPCYRKSTFIPQVIAARKAEHEKNAKFVFSDEYLKKIPQNMKNMHEYVVATTIRDIAVIDDTLELLIAANKKISEQQKKIDEQAHIIFEQRKEIKSLQFITDLDSYSS